MALQEDMDELNKEQLITLLGNKNQPLKDFFLLIDSLISLESHMHADPKAKFEKQLTNKIDYMLDMLKRNLR